MVYGVYATAKHNTSKTAVKEAAKRAEDELAVPVICEVAKLEKQIQVPQSAIAGKPITATLLITNKMDRPCYFDMSGSTLTMKVATGNETVFDGPACPVKIPVKRILLDRGMEWKMQTTWDGKVRANGCAGGDAALAGTYRLNLYFGDKQVGKEQVVTLTAPPPPPEPKDKDAKDKDSEDKDSKDKDSKDPKEKGAAEKPAPEKKEPAKPDAKQDKPRE